MDLKKCIRCYSFKDVSLFNKNSRYKDGLDGMCSECNRLKCKEWAKNNKDKLSANRTRWIKYNKERYSELRKRWPSKEGYCVFKATYDNGVYIGYGLTVDRRRQHLNGNESVYKGYLKGDCKEFEVLFKGTREQCLDEKIRLVKEIGIDNLLNKRI